MPGQNSVVAQHYPDHFHTVSFPLHGSTITRGAITPLLYVEKQQLVVDDVRLITRVGEDSLTIDVGFTPGATPTGATWSGTYTCSVASSTTVTIVSTVSGSLSVGDRLVANSGAALTNIPVGAYIASFDTYTVATGTGTVVISAAATGTSTGASGTALSFKSVLTAPMSAATATNNSVVVGAINSNNATVPTAAPNSLEVTTPNNIVPGPITTPSTLGSVLCVEARGAATANYIGTLQIRYRDRLA
jgi:hypothetical protein